MEPSETWCQSMDSTIGYDFRQFAGDERVGMVTSFSVVHQSLKNPLVADVAVMPRFHIPLQSRY